MMETIPLVEWLGYLASVITAISLLMSSIIKLRWFNLFGSLTFCVYGFVINAYPVGLFNGFIVFVNIYYLFKIYNKKEFFKLQIVETTDGYLGAFFQFYKEDLQKYFPSFSSENMVSESVSLLVLRNMAVAGVFIGEKLPNNTLRISVDFAIPEYRDFKLGRFVYRDNASFFDANGIKRLVTETRNKEHFNYLMKMGFVKVDDMGESSTFEMVL